MLSPNQQRWIVPTAANMFLNASTTSTPSLSPHPSRPRTRQIFRRGCQQPVVLSQRVLSPVSPVVLSLPQPTERNAFSRERQGHHPVALEVTRSRHPRAPSGIWGDGTKLELIQSCFVYRKGTSRDGAVTGI